MLGREKIETQRYDSAMEKNLQRFAQMRSTNSARYVADGVPGASARCAAIVWYGGQREVTPGGWCDAGDDHGLLITGFSIGGQSGR